MQSNEDATSDLRDSDTQPGAGVESNLPDAELNDPRKDDQDRSNDDGIPAPTKPSALPAPTSPTQAANKPGDHADDLLTKLFQFLSTATPETLGGIAAGLAAVTYFILGQVGLLLIGALAGITLFISWERRRPDVARAVKGEKGLDAVARLLDYREALRAQRVKAEGGATNPNTDDEDGNELRGFEDFQPETRDALNGLVDAVIRDYVKWWYTPIVPTDKAFPLSCRKIYSSYLLAISNHLSRKRPADTFLDFLTNSSSIFIVFFSELSAAFAELPPDSDKSAPEAIRHYLAANPDSSLANLLNKKQQAAKFRMVAEDLLRFLDRPTYDCDPARVFLREVMANVVLEMTLASCAKAEWINGWIVHLLEAGEPDFNQAIDSGMQRGADLNNSFADLDGNVGNIALTKGNRNSFDMEKARRKENAVQHKKKLSRADEEMEAMEEMRRLNEMIAQEDARRAREEDQRETVVEPFSQPAGPGSPMAELPAGAAGPPSRLADAIKRTANEPDLQPEADQSHTGVGRCRLPDLLPEKSTGETSGDETSGKGDSIPTPLTPHSSEMDAASDNYSPQPVVDKNNTLSATSTTTSQQFTSFDQIVPAAQDEDETETGESESKTKPLSPLPPLTLHNATVSIHDDGMPDKVRIKNKPTWDYLIQVEPASSRHRGWMMVRKYSDFEQLHEVLGRIAKISGATAFTEQHNALPAWKVHTRGSLRGELERYCRDACWYQPLAESEGMKRFLDKDNIAAAAQKGHGRGPSSKSGFEAFETMGKNVLGVLQSAPKGVAEGGKVVVGGMTGVLGTMGLGARRNTTNSSNAPAAPVPLSTASSFASSPSREQPNPLANGGGAAASRLSISTLPRMDSSLPIAGGGMASRKESMDSQRSSIISTQPSKVAPMESPAEADGLHPRMDRWEPSSRRSSREHSRASSMAPLRSPSSTSLSGIRLPPPPSDMPDDYGFHAERPLPGGSGSTAAMAASQPRAQARPRAQTQSPSPSRPPSMLNGHVGPGKKPARTPRQAAPLTEQETGVAVELLFAVISELYTLSSAWNIRRTLLAAAKSFLLRPGNPSLASVRALIQGSVLDANSSDAGVAAHLRKLRENALPTEEELAAWPAEMDAEEKERLRTRARALLIRSGVPAALSGVMGQGATGEALGRVFDCLQIEEVARGLLFGVMLQAARAITH